MEGFLQVWRVKLLLRSAHVTAASPAVSEYRGGAYFLTPGGGTTAVPWHFPLPVLPPVSRPDASRWVPLNDPEGLAFVV